MHSRFRSLTDIFARNTFWSIGGTLSSRLLMMLTTLLLTYMVGPEQYGKIGYTRTTVVMLASLAGYAFILTLTRQIAAHKTTSPDRIWPLTRLLGIMSVTSGVVLSVSTYLAAPWISSSQPELIGLIRLASPVILLDCLSSMTIGVLNGLEEFRRVAVNQIIAAISGILSSVVLVYFLGIKGAILGLMIQALLLVILSMNSSWKQLTRRGFPFSTWRATWSEWPVITQFSFPVLLGSLICAPADWIGNTLLLYGTGDFRHLAAYDIANQFRMSMQFFSRSFNNVSLPKLSQLSSEGNWSSFNRVLVMNLTLSGVMTTLLASPLLVAPGLIATLYGLTEFADAQAIRWLAVAGILMSFSYTLGHAILSRGHPWLATGTHLITNVLLAVSTLACLGVWKSALALSVANVIAYGVHFLIHIIVLRHLETLVSESTPSSNVHPFPGLGDDPQAVKTRKRA